MKLDIIVPHYKEPWEICRYLFDTIACQRGIDMNDIRVLVVNDGDEVLLDEKNFANYPYKIEYLVKEHGGVSDTRNAGLMYSDADYVMFCDIDDGFLSNYGLHLIFNAMTETNFDFLNAAFVEETITESNELAIVLHNKDLTFMHGKAYRRKFLLDNDILFDPAMTIHEDGYFNMLAYAVSNRSGVQKSVDTPIYLWRWNDQSVVRRDREDFTLKTYDHVMRARIGICNEMKRRGYQEEFEASVCMTVLNSYYDFQKTAWRQSKYEKQMKAALQAFKGFYKLFRKDFQNCTNLQIAEYAKVARATATSKGMLMEQEDLRSFLRRIDALKG